jgi:Ca2+/H+ antiporter
MGADRINKDSKFSLFMLIMTVVVIIGNAKLTVESMNATLFALNYRRGIVARGLFGWILDVICSIFGERFYCYQTVFVICTLGYILYLCVLWFFAKKFIAETGSNCLDEIAAKIATSIFFCSCIQIEVYLMGIAAEPDSEIIVNNRFGLNYIDIK